MAAGAGTREQQRAVRIRYVPLDELRKHPRNPKAHDLEALAGSVNRFGFVTPIVLNDRDGTILEGHGRLETLEALRAKDAELLPAGLRIRRGDGMWLVPVVSGVDLAPEEADAFVIAANRTVELGGWDEATLADLLRDMSEHSTLEGTGYSPADLDKLIASLALPESAPETADPDREPPGLPEEPLTQLGDVWELGPHRLICGDAHDDATIDRLLAGLEGGRVDCVLTDPPYAIYGSSSGLSESITDDKITRPFFVATLRQAERCVKLFGHVYVHCDWRGWPSLHAARRGLHLEPKNVVVWDKGSGLGNNWANTYELIGFFTHMPVQQVMKSGGRQGGQRPVLKSNVIRCPRPYGDERLHNAAKPVRGLLDIIVDAGTEPGEAVLDLFGGSGSTLMACEVTGRVAYVSELEPAWCDVIVARWERHTGQKARRIEAAVAA